MRRRRVNLLLVPCVLLTQSVMLLAHAHCPRGVGDRGITLHFHWPSWPMASSPGHHHGVVAPSREAAIGCRGQERADGPNSLVPVCPDEHDTDAIYIGRILFFSDKRGSSGVSEKDAGLLISPLYVHLWLGFTPPLPARSPNLGSQQVSALSVPCYVLQQRLLL